MAKKPTPPGSSSIPSKKKAPMTPPQVPSPKDIFGEAGPAPASVAPQAAAPQPAPETQAQPQQNTAQNNPQNAQGPAAAPRATIGMPEPEQFREMPPLRAAARANDPVRRIIGATIADAPPRANDNPGAWPFWTGLGLSAAWFLVVFFVVMNASGKIAGMPITSVALGISGVLAPVAFMWMVIAYLQRASDIKAMTEPLRRQLQMIVGTGTAAEGRVRRFNEALEKQLELLRQSGDGSYDVLQNAIQVLQEEEKAIHALAERSGKEIGRVAGIVRDNSEVLEDLLHDNRERFNDLSGKIAGNIATLDNRASQASDRLGEVVDRMHTLVDQFKSIADEKLTKCADISEKMSEQETRTQEAANRMTKMLEGARSGADELNRIMASNQDILDESGSRLVGRMTDVTTKLTEFTNATDEREQKLADKSRSLANTLAREIATLESLTGRMEAQISAANEGLGAQSEVLELRHGRIAEQASSLMANLQGTMRALEENADSVFAKFNGFREHIAQQSERVMTQFNLSSDNYTGVAGQLDSISRNVVERISAIGTQLEGQVENIARSTERAAEASGRAGQSVNNAMQQLELMIGRIFDAEMRATESTGNITGAYDKALQGLNEKTAQIGDAANAHIARLAITHDEFESTAQRLAEQARTTEGTWQSLVSASEKQQEILREGLRLGIEEAVAMLNDSASAIEGARDDMHRHIESSITRSQDLAEHIARIGNAAGAPFDAAVAKVRASVNEGEAQLSHFANVLEKNAEAVKAATEKLTTNGEQAGHKAAEALAGLDAVSARMEAIQHDSMESTQEVLLRLDRLVAQLQSRMSDLSGTASEEQKKLAESVKHLSFDINGLIHDSQTAEARIRLAASVLSEQASGVRGQLETQVAAVEDVTRRYHQFAEVSHSGFEEKMQSLGASISGASSNLDHLAVAIDGRVQQLGIVQNQLQDSGRMLDSTTQAALDRLSVFTHALVAAQTTTQETAQSVYARLSDMEGQFKRQIENVSEGSETMAQSMRQAVADLVEQSVGLAAASQQAEARVATLAGATAELQSQAQIVRMAIETEASAMQNRMGGVLAQIESACVGLERSAVIAFDRTEGMAKRFDKVSDAAFGILGESAMQIGKLADQAVTKITDVNKAMGEQIVGLTFAGEHLGEISREVSKSLTDNAGVLSRLSGEVGATGFYAAEQLSMQVMGLKVEADTMLERFDLLGRGLARQSMSVLDISDILQRDTQKLTASIAAAEGVARTARQAILAETAEFRNEVANGAQNITIVGDALQQRGDFAIAMVHQMAQRFTEATQQLKGQFETQAERVKTITDGAQGHLRELGDVLTEQAGKLGDTTSKLGSSGQAVGETLEKANFLLRNLSGQIDRMKGSAAEISDSFIAKLESRMTGYEAELKGMTAQAGASIEDLAEKARNVNAEMQADAKTVADHILAMLHDMSRDVAGNMGDAATAASQAVAQLKADSADLGAALRRDAEEAITGPAKQLSDFHNQFRETFTSMAAQILGHLQQVRDSGVQIVAEIRSGAASGADQAAQVMSSLRTTAEGEVRRLTSGIEETMRQLNAITSRIGDEMAGSSDAAQQQLLDTLSRVKRDMQGEMQNLVSQASNALGDMQNTCDELTQHLAGASADVLRTTQEFGRMNQAISHDAQNINATMTATNSLLQRSQATLFDVAQKSGDALGLFNQTVERQAESLQMLQSQFAETASNMAETDQRMNALKSGFQHVMSDLMQQLNTGMLGLGQQILDVRREATGAIGDVNYGTENLAQQKHAITSQAVALANALAQLEQVNRTLADNMRASVADTTQQVEKFERQTERVRQASETTGQWVTSLGQHMQNQLAQISREMERTVGTMGAASRTPSATFAAPASSFAPAATPAPAPAPVAAPAAASKPGFTSSYAAPAAKPVEAANDPLQKLRDMAKANEKPAATAPNYAAPTYKPATAATPAKPAAAKADTDLINSLSQIIQQLEDTAGGKDTAEALRRKIGK